MAGALAAAAALAVLCACSEKPGPKPNDQPKAARTTLRVEKKGPETEEIGWLTLRVEDAPTDSLMSVKPEDLPAHVRSLYRLRPDRRFLYAAAELERLTKGGERKGTLSIRFEKERWQVSLDGSGLGDLPENSGFADAKGFLAARLTGWTAAKAPSGAQHAPMDLDGGPATLLPALASLGPEWAKSPGDPELTEAALEGYLWLSLQTFDLLELADPILGKTLTLLVIAQGGQAGRFVAEECLLADLLGYEDHAQLLAQQLPADDPVRLFASWDVVRLKELAHRRGAQPRSQYLHLLRLAQTSPKEEAWFQELDASSWGQRIGIPSLRLVLTLDPWGPQMNSLMELEIRAALTIRKAEPGRAAVEPSTAGWRAGAAGRLASLVRDQPAPESRLPAFETSVRSEAVRLDGPILDRNVVQAFYLASFYSSVYQTANFCFDRFGSTDEAEKYGNSLENTPPGTAAELKDWILHRVHLRRSAEGFRAVVGDLARLRHIGVAALSRIVYSVSISISNSVDPAIRAPLPAYFDRLDSRPSNLDAAFRAASQLLNDPAIREQTMRLAVRRNPRWLGTDLPWALHELGDENGLRALAADRTSSSAVRSAALQYVLFGAKGADERKLLDRVLELVREYPLDMTPLEAAVGSLEKRGEIESALRLIDSWLKTHVEHDLEWARMTSSKSRLLRKQGKPKEAWKFASEAVQSWKEDCMEEAALTLIDLGRLDEALEMARNALGRYGDDGATILVARILWMQGKDEEAGRLVADPKRRLTSDSWANALPDAFLLAFRKADDVRAQAAFQKFFVPSVPQLNYNWFLDHLTWNGRAALTEKICADLRGRGPAGFTTVVAYHAKQKAQGAAAARDWLRANATPADLDVLAKQALQDADYDLVWDLPDHPDATKNEILYMIRAACLLYPKQASEERRATLETFFEGRPKKDFVVYGLYFLGKADRPMLFGQIKDMTYVASVSWILGVSSAHEKRYQDANGWFQVCMETGQNIPPRYWTNSTLSRWRAEGGTLADLERKGIF